MFQTLFVYVIRHLLQHEQIKFLNMFKSKFISTFWDKPPTFLLFPALGGDQNGVFDPPQDFICRGPTRKPFLWLHSTYPSYQPKIFYRALRPSQKILQISEVFKWYQYHKWNLWNDIYERYVSNLAIHKESYFICETGLQVFISEVCLQTAIIPS